MKVAIPDWNGMVSPVFDVARRLVVITLRHGRQANRREAALSDANPAARTERLTELGVDVLICGAISWPLEAMLTAAGVRVVPHVCGTVEEVLQAFASGQLNDQRFRMPGCPGGRNRRRGRRGRRWYPFPA